MTNNIKFLTFILTLGFATCFLVSCNKDDDNGGGISEAERNVLEDLVGTWTAESVTQNGEAPQKGDYTALVLDIDASLKDGSGKEYSVTNGGPALPTVSGASWSFLDGSLNTPNPVIVREDGSSMRINELTSTKLVLQQDVDTELQDGRVATIGRYIYTFSK